MLKVFCYTALVGFGVVKILGLLMDFIARNGQTCKQIADTALVMMCK